MSSEINVKLWERDSVVLLTCINKKVLKAIVLPI